MVANQPDNKDQEQQANHRGRYPSGYLEFKRLRLFRRQTAAEGDLRQQDHNPHPDGGESGQRGDHQENVLRHNIVKIDREQQRDGHHHHRHPRHPAT